jgi:hypothetical protein
LFGIHILKNNNPAIREGGGSALYWKACAVVITHESPLGSERRDEWSVTSRGLPCCPRCKLDEREVVGPEFVVARRDPTTLLDLVKEPLNQVAGTVEVGTEADRFVAITSGGNVGPNAPLGGKCSNLRSRHGAPDRKTQKMPLRMRRSFTRGTRRVWPLKTARHRGISRIWLGLVCSGQKGRHTREPYPDWDSDLIYVTSLQGVGIPRWSAYCSA